MRSASDSHHSNHQKLEGTADHNFCHPVDELFSTTAGIHAAYFDSDPTQNFCWSHQSTRTCTYGALPNRFCCRTWFCTGPEMDHQIEGTRLLHYGTSDLSDSKVEEYRPYHF